LMTDLFGLLGGEEFKGLHGLREGNDGAGAGEIKPRILGMDRERQGLPGREWLA
jgi:hypothetical protein